MTAATFKNFEEFKKMKGKDLPTGQWITVTQEMINAFATATNDHQWIHTDVVKAQKKSPFGTTVAHGFLSLSLVAAMIGDIAMFPSVKMAVNYGLDRVRFPSPVPVNSRLRLLCRVAEIVEAEGNGLKVTWHCVVEMEHTNKPACVCELISMMFESCKI